MEIEIAVIFLLWFALQVPLGIFIGKCIHFGNEGQTFAYASKAEC